MLNTEVVEDYPTLAQPRPVVWEIGDSSATVLVTGAAGFFGSHFIEHVICNTDWNVVAMVRMGKVGNLRRMLDSQYVKSAWKAGRLKTVWHDFNSPVPEYVHKAIGPVDFIVHAGAETHVDRSITHPRAFVQSNVVGTLNMLEYARDYQPDLEWFNYFSTDEVYGPAPPGVNFLEDSPLNPTNPYSAAKAGGEALANAYGNTYGLPVFITNTMNLIGERQDPEKFVPLIMNKVFDGDELKIHANAEKTQAGSRFYLHCRNAAAALVFLLENAEQRGRYNIVGDVEVDNLKMARLVHEAMCEWWRARNFPLLPLNYELVDFHSSRPGHDLRYALDGQKLKDMGFTYPVSFEESLEKSVWWLMENQEWLGR